MTAQAPVAFRGDLEFRPPTARKRGLPSAVGAVAAALFGLVIIVPWQTESTRAAVGYLDFSWVWALSEAFAHGRVFGRDLIFTAGPLGFLSPKAYVPDTGALLWIWWSAIAVAWSLLLWRLLARTVANLYVRIGLFAWTAFCGSLSSDAFFLAIPVLAVAIAITTADDSQSSLDLLGVAALLAVGSLVKFSFLVAATATIGILGPWDIARRRWPASAITFLATILILWTACGQPLGAIVDFLKTSSQVAGGYTPTMSLSTADRRVLYGVISTMALGLFVGAWVTLKRRSLPFGLVTLIWLGTWLLVAKASFARFDEVHEVIAPLWVASVIPMLWALTLRYDAGPAMSAIAVVLLIASAVSSEIALRDARRPGFASSAVHAPQRAFHSLRVMVNPRRGLSRERTRFEAMRAGEVARTPLPPITGTVDAYPTDISAVLAHRFAYAPRPMIQSYAAYTPRLAELNAAHLRGEKAADNLILDVAPIDQRLASMEDGQSWIEMWRRYSFVGDTGGFLWLRRRATPIAVGAPHLLSSSTATLGVPVPLPAVACGGIMATVELRPTLRYRLGSLFWKAPEIDLRFTPGDEDRRVEPTLITTPFLVSPRIDTRRQFATFMQSGTVAPTDSYATSVALRVLSPHPERYFAPQFTLRFFSIQPVASCPDARAAAP